MTSEVKKSLDIKTYPLGPLETNCYMVYEMSTKNGILIDPGAYAPQIIEFVRDNNITLSSIVHTHGHADHIRGDASYGLPVIIHRLDGPYLSDPKQNLSFYTDDPIKPIEASRLMEEGDTIDVGGMLFEVIHTPGHTPGGVSLKCNDILFTGDALFYEGIGRTDLPGGDHATLISSIKEKLFTLPDNTRVFPGHGPETTIGHEKRNNPFF